ncbi:8225_t:CDS:2, partial [Entrophospora sp. SA101]
EREMRAWHAMLRVTGCTEITPVSIDKLEISLWLKFFNKSLEQYKTGYDGKIRILSIISSKLQYEENSREFSKYLNSPDLIT